MKTPRFALPLLATGALSATAGFGLLHAQDTPSVSPASTVGTPLPPKPGPHDGPGPRGERPPPPPRPEDDASPAKPVDSQAAPVAVKTAGDALAKLSAGQVWVRTAPRGEQQVQATLVCDGKDVARLEFDLAGTLLTRGQRPPVPPRADAGHDQAANAKQPTPNLDAAKDKLAGIVTQLSVGQGAEIMSREGFWKVPLIYQSRVVGELRVSGDGAQLIQDFGASRDAAIFAR